MVPEAAVAEGARVQVAALLKLEVPGVPTAQVVAVGRQEAKLARPERWAEIMLLAVGKVGVEEAVQQSLVGAAQDRR